MFLFPLLQRLRDFSVAALCQDDSISCDRALSCDRTLEKVRWGSWKDICEYKKSILSEHSERSNSPNAFTISDLAQSIKGNFSRRLHIGNIWQKRFLSSKGFYITGEKCEIADKFCDFC